MPNGRSLKEHLTNNTNNNNNSNRIYSFGLERSYAPTKFSLTVPKMKKMRGAFPEAGPLFLGGQGVSGE